MDLFGIRMMIEQKLYQYSKWLKKVRGAYTNKDMIVDIMQIVIILIQLAIIIL